MVSKVWAWIVVLLMAAAGAGGTAGAQVPPAEQWEPVGESQDLIFSLNLASLDRTGDVATFQLRVDGLNRNAGARHVMIVDSSMDCAGRTVTARSLRRFDADGRLLESREIPAAEGRTEPVTARVPIYAAVFRRACGGELPD